MSYCVNCGVELADSEKRCPLCGVEVVNPVKPWVEPKTPPYPERLERIMSRIDRRFFAGLLGVILLIPVCITLLIDLLANNGVTWSAYVVGGITVFFFVVVFPLILKKNHLYELYAIDFSVILLYLLLINVIDDTQVEWFFPLAMPLVLILAAIVVGSSVLFQHKLKSFWTRAAAILFSCGCYTVCINILIELFCGRAPIPRWSMFVWIPCTLLAAGLMILRSRKRLLDELHRRLFI